MNGDEEEQLETYGREIIPALRACAGIRRRHGGRVVDKKATPKQADGQADDQDIDRRRATAGVDLDRRHPRTRCRGRSCSSLADRH